MSRNKRALLNTEADWIVVPASGTHIGRELSSRVNVKINVLSNFNVRDTIE